MKTLLGGLAAAALLAVSASAHATVLVNENFNDGVADGFTGANGVATAPSAEKFLGYLNLGETGTLTAGAGYENLVLSFDLYVIRSMDGEGPPYQCCGPDPFRVIVNGSTVVFDHTFANRTDWEQSYGGPLAPGRTGSDSALYGALGYGDYFGTNSVYHISLSLGSGVTSFGFQGATSQGWESASEDEAYGVDNVVLTGDLIPTQGGVPEPATWAMMIGGFVGMGAMLRRRARPKTA